MRQEKKQTIKKIRENIYIGQVEQNITVKFNFDYKIFKQQISAWKIHNM